MMRFMDLIKFLVGGMMDIAESYTTKRDYVRPAGGPEKDHANLVNDVRTVGHDIKQTISTYGEQPYQRPRDKQSRASAFH